MAGKDIIMINQMELRQLDIIHKVMEKRISQVEGADILGLSERQIRRIVRPC